MNNDLISRSALKKAIDEAVSNFELSPIRANEVVQIIDNAPPVEERPTGEWIEKGKYQVECDQCHYDDCAIKTNFCPNCGAAMIGENTDT